jgi:asparagine synthase (glutamine-hydrolysing)
MVSETEIPSLAKLLEDAICANLPSKVAVPLSGGLDSSLLATIASKKVKVLSITVGTKDAPDLEYAKKAAHELGIEQIEHIFTKEELAALYPKCQSIYPSDFLTGELLVPLYKCCELAKEQGCATLLSGSGAEEAFFGYDRYYKYLGEGKDLRKILDDEMKTLPSRDISAANAIAKFHSVLFLYPFTNKPLFEKIKAIPIPELAGERSEKKPILRRIARSLGVPELACSRPKKAMQYGSGVHKVLLLLKKNRALS